MVATHEQAEIGRIQVVLGTQQVQHHRSQLLREGFLQGRPRQSILIRCKQQLQRRR